MTERKEDRKVSARREFLKLSTLGVAAAGAAAVIKPAPAEAAEPQGSGYRETAHVRTYYESARF